jgi:hypothetical protein
MTDPHLDSLLARASKPPAPPLERFTATIPTLAPPARPAPARWSLLLAAAAAVALAGGALMMAQITSPATAPTPGAAAVEESAGTVTAYAEDDAFAAVLSGELSAEDLSLDTGLTP